MNIIHKPRKIRNGHPNCFGSQNGNPQFDDPLITEHNIRCFGTDIYFFDDVNEETQMILQTMLNSCVAQFMTGHVEELLNGESLHDYITIHINSPGGYASSGFALYDFIKNLSIPVCCSIEGDCSSAATLIFLAGSVRTMSENSSLLIHQISWGGWGKYDYMQDMSHNADKSMKKLIKIYRDETTIGQDCKTDEERDEVIREMLSHDIDFDREECLNYGFIVEPEEQILSEDSMNKLNEFANQLLEKEHKVENQKTVKAKVSPKTSTTKKTKKTKAGV